MPRRLATLTLLLPLVAALAPAHPAAGYELTIDLEVATQIGWPFYLELNWPLGVTENIDVRFREGQFLRLREDGEMSFDVRNFGAGRPSHLRVFGVVDADGETLYEDEIEGRLASQGHGHYVAIPGGTDVYGLFFHIDPGTYVGGTATVVVQPLDGTVPFLAPDRIGGDYNGDGSVDASDYTVWRDGLYQSYDYGAFELWRSVYGASVDPPSAGGAVPEPGTLTCVLLATAALGLTRRGRAA